MGRELGSRGTAWGTNISPVSELGEMFVLKFDKKGIHKGKEKTERTLSAKSKEKPAKKSAGISCAQAGTKGVQGLLPCESVLTLEGYLYGGAAPFGAVWGSA